MSNSIPIATPLRTRAIVNRYFMKAKKSLGQNFLVDLPIVKKIVASAGVVEGSQVIEIGPGIGSLTEQLLLAGAKVLAYEVDPDLPDILYNELPAQIGNYELNDRFRIIMKDILKADFATDIADYFDVNRPIIVVANLPYYITTPIILKLMHSPVKISQLTLMMQKEVAERISASHKSKAYGPLTIAVKKDMDVDFAFEVKRTSFMPSPKVDSAVVVLKPLEHKLLIEHEDLFNQIVKLAFSQRRKTLNNNLKSLIKDKDARQKLLNDLNLDSNIRPEELSILQYIELSKKIFEQR
ncbi:16S rRNA (adenine(1518)-N(6)/adenine(1519)-N(6))-dimethyltransferase RsmA [Lactobacillus iners]|jgi:hypothetical protein|uniref:16S rRNA (adenine(1518)-N(6)/adenine(1519)-N(6))- dimethyltransferase RsmA n=1 Tax=Lactobacillus iners TaxID=147802 RepID=UPI0001F11030|nr:16S rRNA (adenine(1518)-N(6)/adenine(1519)-N(6))-dimethyltransferase RsmA [Lactobacillus iners]EFU78374.1 dimethyladenosine transferase [Lactobacillus iners ATCC 55195]EGY58384.1 ribosomal RNA small subunit methyltransferase A [Lactobacillus iners]MBW8450044.1 16S rRNA (adenine(1518)-N(6)/adenine(1519)-N(6))-dimethyltransferase RsmA [Lactobacillus iners]MCT7838527.1 16S rRNA (adenine(1518)-N(6)/adenine(1519)-N(6))-dimethyltransferase RsmA [Lactobacillus iners]MCT7874345.1 16S rRNA (adenine(